MYPTLAISAAIALAFGAAWWATLIRGRAGAIHRLRAAVELPLVAAALFAACFGILARTLDVPGLRGHPMEWEGFAAAAPAMALRRAFTFGFLPAGVVLWMLSLAIVILQVRTRGPATGDPVPRGATTIVLVLFLASMVLFAPFLAI